MKILSLLVVLLALFRETRHQFPIFYPPFSISLANEEFIEPPPIVGDVAPSIVPKSGSIPNDGHPNNVINTDSPPKLSVVANGQDKPSSQDPTQKVGGHSDIPSDVPRPSPTPGTTPVLSLQDLQLDPVTRSGSVESEQGSVLEGVHSGDASETGGSNQNVNNVIIITEGEGNGSHQEQKQSSSPPGPIVIDTPKKGDDEEPIPSYMEWAQKKQLELKSNLAATGQNGSPGGNGHGGNHQSQGQNGQSGQTNGKNGSVASSGIDAKNYKNFASPDCGAKVVQSNAESQNPNGVLSSSQDEYMLNKCGTAIWFVVELCEPLTVERISIGNLELFSSSPKEVEFGISDRYPTRDWTRVGPLTLPDARAIHPVVLPAANASTFGKFVKFSVHSHYGSEHYCPISVIRVNGKTEYEVLESETTHQEDENKEGGSLYEEPIEEHTQSSTESSGGKVGGLKDAVLNILNKAVQSIVRRGYSSDSKEASETDLLLQSRCRSVLQCVPHSVMTHDIYRLLSCNSSNVLPFLATHSPWCGWDYCHATFESRSIGLPWQPEGFYASLFGGPTVLHALCHYLKPLTDGCDPTCLAMNNTLQDGAVSEFSNESLTTDNATVGGFPGINTDQEAQIPRTPLQQETTEEQVPVLPSNPTGGNGDTTQPPEQQQQMETPPLNSGSGQQIIPPTDSNNVSPPPPLQQQETQIPSPSPIIQTEEFSSMQQGSGQPQQKESVFVRLTNRIKNLERNQSLTASYLEELSKRFKKQNEDNAVIVDSNKKTLNETRVKLFQLDEFYRQESQSLRRNLDDVRERLFNVQLQRSLLVIICVSQTVLIVGAIIWAKKKLASFGQQLEFATPVSFSSRRLTLTDILSSQSHQQHPSQERRRDSDPLTPGPRQVFNATTVDASDERLMVMRKRSNSDSVPNEKAKRLRKRNKKQQLLNARITDSKPNNPNIEISHDFNLKMPKSSSGDGFFDGSAPVRTGSLIQKNNSTSNSSPLPFTPKENVDPQLLTRSMPPSQSNSGLPKSRSLVNSNSNSPTPFQTRPTSLQQPQSDSTMFPLQSQISPPFMDSGISTSSRFALLASPVRDSQPPSPSLSGRERYFMPSSAAATLTSAPECGPLLAPASYNRSGSTESSNSIVSTQSGSGSGSLSPPSSTGTGTDGVRARNGSGMGLAGIFNGNRHKNQQHSPSISSNDSASIPTSAVIAEDSQGKKVASSKKGGLKANFAKFFDR